MEKHQVRRHFGFLFIILLSIASYGQNKEKKSLAADNCKATWRYFDLETPMKGQVLFHAKALTDCGIFSTASVTIIKTHSSDTVRVLELCNTEKDFKRYAEVVVEPTKRPNFIIDIIPDNHKNCDIKKTCFGTIAVNR